MNSLLKSVKSLTNKKHVLIKESLRKQLNSTIMEMENIGGINNEKIISDCEETIALCSILEAIFLHGLKDSLLNRVTEVLSGPDIDAMPQPSFWGPLLVFSHSQIIDEIQNYKQIISEVGFCRTWIRTALNQGLLSSYLSSIQRDNKALKPYYEITAFIRDNDCIESAKRLIETIEQTTFDLACNTSLLNYWSSTPLLMAAIWSPPMKSSPVFSAVDIAKTINCDITINNINHNNYDDVETASSIGSVGSFTSQSILGNYGAINEDDALKIILSNNTKHDNKNKASSSFNSHTIKPSSPSIPSSSSSSTTINITDNLLTKKIDAKIMSNEKKLNEIVDKIETNKNKFEEIENKIEKIESKCLTNDDNLIIDNKFDCMNLFNDGESSSMTSSMISKNSTDDSQRTPGENATYDALIKSYHTSGYSQSPDIRDFLNKFTPDIKLIPEKSIDNHDKVVDKEPVDIMNEQIDKLPREKGLDVQNYSCFDCDHVIGMTFGKSNVCSFSGNYYCNDCMADEEFSIPSRIIHNWDLKTYQVSQRAAIYLTDCKTILDLKIINPKIYMAVDSMAQLQQLRIQLNLLRAYLLTCRDPVINELEDKVKPRCYLYEHVHQYSVGDLLDVSNGTLAQQLLKIIDFAKNHVANCWLCSQKGFICEVCNNSKIIYPFDVESTFRVCSFIHSSII